MSGRLRADIASFSVFLPQGSLRFYVHAFSLRWPVTSAENFIEALQATQAPIAPILYAVFTLSAVLCLPAAWLTFACGALLGLVPGTIVANLSAVTSAALTKVLARGRLGRPIRRWVENHSKLGIVLQVLEDGGWKLAFMIRLNPALPLGLSHWVFAFVDMPMPRYLLVTSLAVLPAQLMWVHFGVTGRESLELFTHPGAVDPARWAFLIATGVASVGSVVFLGGLSRRRFQAEVQRTRPSTPLA